jgi:hypothetical protein
VLLLSGASDKFQFPEVALNTLQEWAQLGGQIVETTIALVAAEKAAFESLRMDVRMRI